MHRLLIPYAIDVGRNISVSATDIGEIMSDVRSTHRLQSTARHDTNVRKALRYECPACGGQIYPHAPVRPGGRYFWSHLPREAIGCPLESKRKMSPDQVNAKIFHGRQEGQAHRDLVALLVRLAEADPNVASVTRGEYVPPTDEMRSQFPYGRFPDVRFVCGNSQIVLEAQLATITLHGINGRRAFYDREGSILLWVMRNFDPRGPMQASVRDIVADQVGQLYSIDNDIVALGDADGLFRLRRWVFLGDDEAEPWESSTVTIAEAASLARPVRWCDDFKKRWIVAYPGATRDSPNGSDPYAMLNEVARQAGLPPYRNDAEGLCMLRLVRLLISLEAGKVTGSGHAKLISLANSFDSSGGHRAYLLVTAAVRHWQPELLTRGSMVKAIERARDRLRKDGTLAWRRSSPIGRIRDVLFPDWKLVETGAAGNEPDRNAA